MQQIISKYGDANQEADNYIFPIFEKGLSPIRQDEIKRNFISFINNNIAKLCKLAGIEKNVGTMETRLSHAAIMKNACVSPRHIKESPCHTSLLTTENYLDGFQNEQKKSLLRYYSHRYVKKENNIKPVFLMRSNNTVNDSHSYVFIV